MSQSVHDGNKFDIESRAARNAFILRRSLSKREECSRCSRDRDEKCIDRHLADAEYFTTGDIECGCGCWLRPIAAQYVPSVKEAERYEEQWKAFLSDFYYMDRYMSEEED